MAKRIVILLVGALLLVTVSTPYAQPNKMYWVEYDGNKISRANLDGSSKEDLITSGLSGPLGIAIDFYNTPNKIYWSENSGNIIGRANLDGSSPEDLITSGIGGPTDIVLHIPAGKIYWGDSSGKISRADLNGSNKEDLITSGLSFPYGIALDVPAGKMYWTDYDLDRISRADLDGSNQENLIAGVNNPIGIALDVPAGKMYWTEYSSESIGRADLDGSNQENLITGLNGPMGLSLNYNEASLPVELSSFTAAAGDGQVTLKWRTESEVDNLGFHVYRALEKHGPYECLTSELIPGAGNIATRQIYRYTDIHLTNGMTYWYKIEDVAFNGTRTIHGPISVMPQAKDEAVEAQVLPTEFGLSQNFPNPFNPTTEIFYQLPEASHMELAVYDIVGHKVDVLVEGIVQAGHWSVKWDANDLASGIYFVRMEAGHFVETRKIALIR